LHKADAPIPFDENWQSTTELIRQDFIFQDFIFLDFIFLATIAPHNKKQNL